ncbi:hypothetical protein T439DRAFT_234140 [Meredithblackwellia eburnea MCA 4105]
MVVKDPLVSPQDSAFASGVEPRSPGSTTLSFGGVPNGSGGASGHIRGQSIHERIRQRVDSSTSSLGELYRTAWRAVEVLDGGSQGEGVARHRRADTLISILGQGNGTAGARELSLSEKGDLKEREGERESKKQEPFFKIDRSFILRLSLTIAFLTLVLGLSIGLSLMRHKSSSNTPRHSSATHSQIKSTPAVTSTSILWGTMSPSLLASQYSMTRAAIPTLPLPSKPLSTSEASSYISSNWPVQGGVSKSFFAFTADPYPNDKLEGQGTPSQLRVTYPPGSMGGGAPGTAGGVGAMMIAAFGNQSYQRAIMSYEIAFSKNFNFVNGGKLPGLYGGAGTCSGGFRSPACFSARLMWRSGGRGEVYAYVADFASFDRQIADLAYGIDLDLGSWNFTVGQWQRVTEVIVLNTVTPLASNTDPYVGPNNGHLSIYFNGNLAFQRDDVVFRTNASVAIDNFMFSTFFGGSGNAEFWGSKGGYSYFRGFEFYSGIKASETVKSNVTATWPPNQTRR